MTLPDLSLLSHEQKDDLIRLLFAEVNLLSLELEKMRIELLKVSDELLELKNRQKKHSKNSSKPPSSDVFKKKTTSLRAHSNNKVGGQKGHVGNTLKQVGNPDKIIQHPLSGYCDECGLPLFQEQTQIKQRRQVFDVPVIACEVVEHQSLELICGCGKKHEGQFPQGVTEPTQYGPNLRALGVHLTQGQLLPFARASELLQDLYGVKISTGTLVNWVEEARGILQPTSNLIAQYLNQAKVVHVDESGLRIAGALNWLHVVANEKLTWYGVHAKRGMRAIEAQGILTKFFGTLVHDCWKTYWELECAHALCNAHLLRELTYIKEITQQIWPQRMIEFLVMANELCDVYREREIHFSQEIVTAFHVMYDSILREGEALHPKVEKQYRHRGTCGQSPAFNLLRRLREHTNAVLFFIQDLSVPFTNNIAERAIRMPKVKQKISGSFRAHQGAENFAVIRSCLDTLRKQGHGMLDTLRRAFLGDPIQPTAG